MFLTEILVSVLTVTVGLSIWIHKRALRKLKEASSRKLELQTSFELINKKNEERRRWLARALHDELGGSLSSLKLMITILERSRYGDDMDIIINIKTQLDTIIATLRNISVSEYPSALDGGGLSKAIEDLCYRQSTPRTQMIDFEEAGAPFPIPKEHELVLFRSVQELVNNIVVHSMAKIAKVSLTWTSDVLHIKVVDDGIGFNEFRKPSNTGGTGLKAIEGELDRIGADFKPIKLRVDASISITYPGANG